MSLDWDKALATWGAVTGTAALLVHLRNFLKDRPRMRIRTRLGNSSRPLGQRFEIDASNIGRRPISTEAILIELRDTLTIEGEATRHSPLQEECRGEVAQRELKEGEGVTFYLNDLLSTFWDYKDHQIYRVGIRDRSGKVWWSRRRTGEQSCYEARAAIEIAKAEFRPYPDSPYSITLLMLKGQRSYTVVSTDEKQGRQQYRFRWQALRAFEREKAAINARMKGVVGRDDHAPNAGLKRTPDGTA